MAATHDMTGGEVLLRRRPRVRRFARYCLVSVVNVAVGQGLLVFAFTVLAWDAVVANLFSAVIAAGPAYVLSRRWVWRMTGRSHWTSEVLPFWGLALLGLAVSTGAVALAETLAAGMTSDRGIQAATVAAAAFGAYGVVWAIRFVLLDRFVFVPRPASPAV